MIQPLDIEKMKSAVRLLAELASNARDLADSENLCQFIATTEVFDEVRELLETEIAALDLSDYLHIDEGAADVSVSFNKAPLVESGALFFLNDNYYQEWITAVRPLDGTNFFNRSNEPKLIVLPNLAREYQGPRLQILSTTSFEQAPAVFEAGAFESLPANEKLKEKINIITGAATIEPLNFVLTNPEPNAAITPMIKLSVIALSACLVQEIRSADSVTLRGLKRLELTLSVAQDFEGDLVALMRNLVRAVSWVSEEKSETRTKLIANRLSLDISTENTFLFGVNKYIADALNDAKEKYEFIIAEKSDEYHKERRAIQTEITKQLQSYAEKTRTILGNFLRDTLAGLFLVGFSLFGPSKPSEIPRLLSNPYIEVLFSLLSVYFLISLVVQTAVNFLDIRQSKAELIKFTKETRNYMRAEDVESFIAESLKTRERTFYVFSGILIFVYVVIIIFCWFFAYFVGILPSIPTVNDFPSSS